jgi:hypothetical protein
MEYYVYALVDPRVHDFVFYIGKGKAHRWRKHLRETYENTLNRKKWAKIQAIRKTGLEPQVVFIRSGLTEDSAYALEKALIAHFGRKDIDDYGCLTNICEDGRPPKSKPGRKMTEEQKKALSERLMGIKRAPYTAEHKAAISEGLRKSGWKRSAEQNERHSQRMKGRKNGPPSEATKLAIGRANSGASNGMFGRTHTDEAKEKIILHAKQNAKIFAEGMRPIVEEAIASGCKSQLAIARYLNEKGLLTRQGAVWGPGHISLLLKRLGLRFGNLARAP